MTVKQMIQRFPEPYRTQALLEVERTRGIGYLNTESDTLSLPHFLGRIFAWDASPQGHKYWAAFKNTLRDKPVVEDCVQDEPWKIATRGVRGKAYKVIND
jgi:hypothetical protein